MDPVSVLAIEVDLDLAPTEDGRRATPRLAGYGEERIHVPTNLDCPGWPDGDQTAALILGSRAPTFPRGNR